jgi:ribose/xylose/arabinose/galactoside ABC-type transport system permease subunit
MALDGQTEIPALTPVQPSEGTYRRMLLTLSRVWAWVFLGILIVFFAASVTVTSEGSVNFLTLRNSQNILVAITPVLLMGLGQTLVIIAGGIDLSVGWVMGLASVISALIGKDLVAKGMDPAAAILLSFAGGVAACTLVGFISGSIIAKLKVPPFIVTLGLSFIVRGVAFLFSKGQTVAGVPTQFRDLGNESLLYYVGGETRTLYFFQRPDMGDEALRALDRIFTWPVIITAIVVVIVIFILQKTQFGRHTYAIGGNKEASLRAGVPVDRHTIMLYMLSAATAGLAGCLHTARFSGGSPIAGDPLLLGSIAAVVIGGVSLFGGEGQVSGTIIGALIIAVLQTGLVMLNVEPFWQFIVVGTVVILAVLIDQSRDLIVGRAEG